jgi:5-methyltetrahydrofolate--homocysteine methyltransferase
VKPSFLGTRVFDNWDLAELARYIDWTPFFQTWELKGRYPADPRGREAGRGRALALRRRQAMLDASSPSAGSGRKAVIGFWPANAVGDDIRLFTGETARRSSPRFTRCASSSPSATGGPTSRCRISSRRRTAARGLSSAASSSRPASRRWRIAERFERANDDYGSIMVKALADRFAEAFAERMHERVRKEFWGYAPTRSFARGTDRRGLCRHPPGARLSGPARPHREGNAVPLLDAERRGSA